MVMVMVVLHYCTILQDTLALVLVLAGALVSLRHGRAGDEQGRAGQGRAGAELAEPISLPARRTHTHYLSAHSHFSYWCFPFSRERWQHSQPFLIYRPCIHYNIAQYIIPRQQLSGTSYCERREGKGVSCWNINMSAWF